MSVKEHSKSRNETNNVIFFNPQITSVSLHRLNDRSVTGWSTNSLSFN